MEVAHTYTFWYVQNCSALTIFHLTQTNRNYVDLDMTMKIKIVEEASASFETCFFLFSFLKNACRKTEFEIFLLFFMLIFSSVVDPNFGF